MNFKKFTNTREAKLASDQCKNSVTVLPTEIQNCQDKFFLIYIQKLDLTGFPLKSLLRSGVSQVEPIHLGGWGEKGTCVFVYLSHRKMKIANSKEEPKQIKNEVMQSLK